MKNCHNFHSRPTQYERLGVCMKRDLASEMNMSEKERQIMRSFDFLNAIGFISLLRNTAVQIIYI